MGARVGPPRHTGLGTNQEAVRRHNLGTVLRHVHGAGQISRAELTGAMGLNRSTIAGLVGELESLGVTERAETPATGSGARTGRPSAGVQLAEAGPHVVAVDLAVDRVAVARVGLGGRVLARAGARLDDVGSAWQVGSTVAGLVRDVVAGVDDGSPLVGIGIAVPGLVRRSDGLIRLAPNLGWTDVSFADIVLAALGLEIPVSVANDANLGAIAEHRRGRGVDLDDLIYVSGSVGVGAGVIVGGVPLAGAGGYAGEVGHLRLDTSGRACHCGNRGCWETEVGAYAIAEAIGCAPGDVAQLDHLLSAYDGPLSALSHTAAALGQGLASLVNAFNPELVVLGGYLSPLYALLRAEVDAALLEQALPAPLGSVSVTLPGLGADSVLLGAAEAAFEPLFGDPVSALGEALVDVRARLVV